MSGRIDVVTIFPEYLAPLDLSLVGKARRDGLLDLAVHDLRDWTHDVHRSVDDAPFGGGAGMVMRPDIWGAGLDEVLGTADHPTRTLLVPTPAGEPLTQALAEELALMICAGGQLVFACGRYEGIDARVSEYYGAREDVTVREVSIGDYVLNGGEAAALVVIEALARLLPGVIGNPESLVEESHGSGGLLEYPVYTRPQNWRERQVPAVLRSGDHEQIRRWRRARAVERTARRRPDLLRAQGQVRVRPARVADLDELADVAARTFPLACPPHLGPAAVAAFIEDNLSRGRLRSYLRAKDRTVLVAEVAGAIVGYAIAVIAEPADPQVQAVVTGRPCAELSKFYVLPEHHSAGVAAELMSHLLEAVRRRGTAMLWLGVNQLNERAQRFYRKHGFTRVGTKHFTVGGQREDDFVMTRPISAAGEGVAE